MAMFVKTLLLLAVVVGTLCQNRPFYDPHVLTHTITQTRASTVTDTVTETHTLRVTTTTDVWVTDYTTFIATATQYITRWDYQQSSPRTYTSIMRVTSTPVFFVTATVGVNSAITETSVFTSFFTTTSTVDLVQSITHVAIAHQVHTVPVVSTQFLNQQIITTQTQILTATVTSTTLYGQ